MGSVSITRWTCDRCGHVEEQEQANWQPDDWGRLREQTPPKADLGDADEVAILCFSCRSELRDWIDGGVDQ